MGLGETGRWLVEVLTGPAGFYVLLITYLSMIALERVLYLFQTRHRYDGWNALASMATSTLSSIIAGVILAFIPIAIYIWLYEARLISPGMVWWTWLLAFIAHDLAYYLAHRLGHRVGFFWAIHHPHHSSEALNTTTAARGFPFGDPLQPVFMWPFALAGVMPEQIIVMAIFKNIWGIFNHTPLVGRMGWLEHVLATPSNHRVHHGRNPQYIDRNYGQVLILWDKWLGTYEPEVETPVYGVSERLTSNNPIVIMFGGFTWLGRKMGRARTFQDKLLCLLMPPEWEPATRPAAQGQPAE